MFSPDGLFCCGHTLLASGDVVIVGGHQANAGYPDGMKSVRVFDKSTTRLELVKVNEMGWRRWWVRGAGGFDALGWLTSMPFAVPDRCMVPTTCLPACPPATCPPGTPPPRCCPTAGCSSWAARRWGREGMGSLQLACGEVSKGNNGIPKPISMGGTHVG